VLANDDGAMDGDEVAGDMPHPPMHEPPGVTEPSVLDKDVPWPARWEPVLGPGGEDLGDGLVQVGGEGAAPGRAAYGRSGSGRRRPPASGGARAPRPGDPQRVRRSIPRPDPGRLLGSGVAAGLVGLATFLVVVLFSFDGSPPPREDSGNVAAVSAPALVGSSAADWIATSVRLEARARESAERQREVARQRRELTRRRERERRHAPPAPSSPQAPPASSSPKASQVAASWRPAAAADPWRDVSAAEREFTPGPWNLN